MHLTRNWNSSYKRCAHASSSSSNRLVSRAREASARSGIQSMYAHCVCVCFRKQNVNDFRIHFLYVYVLYDRQYGNRAGGGRF